MRWKTGGSLIEPAFNAGEIDGELRHRIISGTRNETRGMASRIINDENRILTVSTVEGIGKNSVAVSMPRIVGNNGATRTLIPQMDKKEVSNLQHSAKIVRKNFDLIGK